MKNIAAALIQAQSQMTNATKDAKNPFFKSKYADLNAIREAVMPSLNANRVVVLQPVTNRDGKPVVHTILLHESGESIESFTDIVTAKQNDPQAMGAAISYARRYALQSIMCVGAEDNDAEAAMNRPATPVPKTLTKTKQQTDDELEDL